MRAGRSTSATSASSHQSPSAASRRPRSSVPLLRLPVASLTSAFLSPRWRARARSRGPARRSGARASPARPRGPAGRRRSPRAGTRTPRRRRRPLDGRLAELVAGLLLRDHDPGDDVDEDARAAGEEEHREREAKQHRVEAEVAAEAAADPAEHAVVAAAAQDARPRAWLEPRLRRLVGGWGAGLGLRARARSSRRSSAVAVVVGVVSAAIARARSRLETTPSGRVSGLTTTR